MLYLSKDYNRINDLVNKYNINAIDYKVIIPEVEGYVDK